ncbi:MAG: hypothetical protein ACI4V2_02135 [Alloprevotella sp.]
MKHSTFLATALGFFASLSVAASSYNEVQLTFTRTGTAVNTVTVSVADENGTAIDGVTAELVSLKKTGDADCEFKANQGTITSNDLTPNYDNTQNGYMTFVFKISGLSDFNWNKCALNILPVNASGVAQTPKQRLFDFEVGYGDSESNFTTLATINNKNVCNTPDATESTRHDVTLRGTSSTASNPLYLKIKLTRTDADGCFVTLTKITLSKATTYPVTLTATENVGNAATFSAFEATTVPDGVNICKVVTNDDNTTATLTKVEGNVIPANQGVILLSSALTSAELTPTSETGEASSFSDNELIAIPNGGTPSAEGKTIYVFNKNSESNALFSLLDTTNGSFEANKACLGISTSGEAPATIRMSLDGNLTGIGAVATEQPAADDNTLYDLAGRRLTKAAKGQICISSGRKIVVK